MVNRLKKKKGYDALGCCWLLLEDKPGRCLPGSSDKAWSSVLVARAALVNDPKLSVLKDRNGSRGPVRQWPSGRQMWFLLRPHRLACRPPCCVLTWVFLCACSRPVSLCVSRFPFLIRTPLRLEQNAPQHPHFREITSLKALSQIWSHSEILGVRTSTWELRGSQVSPKHHMEFTEGNGERIFCIKPPSFSIYQVIP